MFKRIVIVVLVVVVVIIAVLVSNISHIFFDPVSIINYVCVDPGRIGSSTSSTTAYNANLKYISRLFIPK